MEFRRLGETKLAVSAITFGAWAAGGWMWGGNDDNDAIKAMRASYDLGITSIDTAPIYGQGKSEELVGAAIKGLPRDKVQILTKYGLRWDLAKGEFFFKSQDNDGKDIDIYKYAAKESIILECENSLKRLGTDYIDLYQIHWPDATTPIEETMEAIIRLKEQGKIREAGVSNYDVKKMAIAEKTIKLASNQVPFSMVNRDIEDELIPYCIENKKSILAYSPLERGLLTGKIKPGHQFGEGDHRAGNKYFKEENIKRTNEFLAKIKPLADEKNATLGQLVIRWTINHPGITVALVGARNAEQAKQNAKAIEIHINGEEMEFINNQLSDLEIVG
ncbi:aldo/keto reductase [Mucilaginibacter pocheonensis]|uniref:Aryl-alcohol dehydrogenase-like predicted oxidoreductase n=1 Tax=Mucilaginibacter pocheonensis TaxID=398050 RepID=A0ABU1TEY9_9SPHI|nr:aldo/keto reductase [Mucilaginibacter pocheonensis]MDR6943960.1 aryl-alcohol dehydrogenase-like predicted oxidoreductase [Mucilaginibacter pocheonensis]